MTEKRLHDAVLTNEWHAVLKSGDVQDRPVSVRLMGERIVVFRTSDGIHAFKDLCIHRGAALSLGRVQNDTLVCPYHGWKYDSKGRCVCIPAQSPDVPIPPRARAQQFFCREQYGLIWVCIGEPTDSVPGYPEYSDEHYRTVCCGPYAANAAAPRVVENFLDFAHLMWVHEGLLGDPEHSEVPNHGVKKIDGRLVTDEIPIYQPRADASGKGKVNLYVKEALRPLTARLSKKDAETGDTVTMLLHAAPIEANKTVAFILVSRNFAFDVDDSSFVSFQDTVMAQDVAIMESQKPEELPLDLQAELNHKSDQMSIAYRRWLSELGVTIGTA
jgi:vanillate O-demethylase monooxygenase subunit